MALGTALPARAALPQVDGDRFEGVQALSDALEQTPEGDRRVELVEALRAQWRELSELALDARADPDQLLAGAAAAWTLAGLPEAERPPGASRLDLLLQAVDLAASLEDPALRATLEQELIDQLLLEGRSAAALESIEGTLAQGGLSAKARCELLMSRSDLERMHGRYGEALASLDEALAAFRVRPAAPGQERRQRAYLDLHRAQVLIDVGLPDRAAPLVARAQAAGREDGSPELVRSALTLAVALAFARDDVGWLLDVLPAQLEQSTAREDPAEVQARLRLRLALAQSHASLRHGLEQPGAAELLEELLLGGDLAGPDHLEALCALAEHDLERGDPQAAAGRIVDLREGTRASGRTPAIRERAHLAELAARIELARGADRAALAAAREQLRGAYEDLLAAWATVPPRAGGVGFLHFEERRAVLSTLIRLVLELEPPEHAHEMAVELYLRAERHGSLAAALEAEPVDVEEARRCLAPTGRGVLTYLPAPHSSYVIWLDAERAEVLSLGPSDAWEEARTRLAAALAQPESADASDLATISAWTAALAGELLPGEIDARVAAQVELSVVGLESLGWLPFELLPLRARGGRPLGLELAVGYLPSLTVGCALERRAGARPPPGDTGPLAVLAVAANAAPADPQAPQLEPLPWRPDDGERLLAAWPRDRTRVAESYEEVRAVLDGKLATGARMLQILAHGLYDMRRELPAGLALGAAGEALWSDEAARITAPPLIVLSVCGVGRGPLRRGDDGVSHMGGPLLVAGADTVLLSPVDLSYQASLALGEVLHARLARGDSPARALLAARRALAADLRWSHPAYHSLLHAVGRAHEPLPGAPFVPLNPEQHEGGPSGDGSRAKYLLALVGGAVLVAGALALVAATRRGRAR